MRTTFVKACTLIVASIALSVSAFAQQLQVGSPAPGITPPTWLNGKPITKFEKGQVYVVEFWATWCEPCIKAMPATSKLSDDLKGKVTFIGVNVMDRKDPDTRQPEDAKSHEERITEWVKANKKNLRYRVVLDDDKDTLVENWLLASDPTGISIPKVFIVGKDGKIAWIGHPGEMKAALDAALAAK